MRVSGQYKCMFIRFLIYGAMGWVVEIFWTGLGSILRRDRRLVAKTYLWMFPIYGGGAIAFEQIHWLIAGYTWLVRGLVWMTVIFAVEYTAGLVLQRWVGECPWDYSGTPLSIHGLIRLDYAPAWFVLGLLFERAHVALVELTPHLQSVLFR